MVANFDSIQTVYRALTGEKLHMIEIVFILKPLYIFVNSRHCFSLLLEYSIDLETIAVFCCSVIGFIKTWLPFMMIAAITIAIILFFKT